MNIPVSNCSSCGACANVCSCSAISMKLDSQGFFRPVIDTEKCIQCGACERACPWVKDVQNPNTSSEFPVTLAAYAKDEEIRLASSSGGIFTILAEKVLDDGGVVVGVAQLSSTRFGHIIVDNKDDLSKLRGSKYVQANAGLTYKEVRNLLKDGRRVLFSGTPCQVAALYSVLGNSKYENLWTVDIVCHGTPSVKVWEKYVDEIEHRANGVLNKIAFRDKSSGWKNYSLMHLFENGKRVIIGHGRSDYMKIFLNRISQNVSCSECHYRKLPRIADITLGDYWNIAEVHPSMDDDKGTSVVLLNTKHGNNLLDQCSRKIEFCISDLKRAIEGNPCIIRSSIEHPKRADFFKDLDSISLKKLLVKHRIKTTLREKIWKLFTLFKS